MAVALGITATWFAASFALALIVGGMIRLADRETACPRGGCGPDTVRDDAELAAIR